MSKPKFEIGDYVKTPTGAEAFVVAVDEKYREATVQWMGRVERADFRWKLLRKVTMKPIR